MALLPGPWGPMEGFRAREGRSLWLCVKGGWESMGLRQEMMKEVEGAQWERRYRVSGKEKGRALKSTERQRKERGRKE